MGLRDVRNPGARLCRSSSGAGVGSVEAGEASLSGAGKEEHPHGEGLQVTGLVDPGQDETATSVVRQMLGSGLVGGGSQCPGPSGCREAPATSACVRECDATRCTCLPREGEIAHGAQPLWPRPGCSLGGTGK